MRAAADPTQRPPHIIDTPAYPDRLSRMGPTTATPSEIWFLIGHFLVPVDLLSCVAACEHFKAVFTPALHSAARRPDRYGRPAIVNPVRCENHDWLKIIIDHPIPPRFEDKLKSLHHSMYIQSRVSLNLLLKTNAAALINAPLSIGFPLTDIERLAALHHAARNGLPVLDQFFRLGGVLAQADTCDISVLSFLLRDSVGGNIVGRPSNDNGPIAPIVKRVIDAGADVNRGFKGSTPLCDAIWIGDFATVKLLVQAGAKRQQGERTGSPNCDRGAATIERRVPAQGRNGRNSNCSIFARDRRRL